MKTMIVAMLTFSMALSPLYAASPVMRCEPQNIKVGQSLTIRMPPTHGGELGVWTPGRKFFFIAFAPEEGLTPPITGAEFKKMRTIKLDTIHAVGLGSISKEATPEKIFHTSGKYQFIVSENLETEDETGANLVCEVRFSQ